MNYNSLRDGRCASTPSVKRSRGRKKRSVRRYVYRGRRKRRFGRKKNGAPYKSLRTGLQKRPYTSLYKNNYKVLYTSLYKSPYRSAYKNPCGGPYTQALLETLRKPWIMKTTPGPVLFVATRTLFLQCPDNASSRDLSKYKKIMFSWLRNGWVGGLLGTGVPQPLLQQILKHD